MNKSWSVREHKQTTREMASDFTYRKSALFMPSNEMRCVLTAMNSGMVDQNTRLVMVERDIKVFDQLSEISRSLPCERHLIHDDLHNVKLPTKLDYAWIDLNGTLSPEVSIWIEIELSRNLKPGAVVCFTQEYGWRNNSWMKQCHEHVMNAGDGFRRSYWDFRQHNNILGNPLISFPAFVVKTLLEDWVVYVETPYHYHDTIDMMFYRFLVHERNQNPVHYQFPGRTMCSNHSPRPYVRRVSVITANEVIQSIAKADSPALKAHATRKLNKYVEQRVSEGKSAAGVRAAIKAHVTRLAANA